MGKGSIAKLTAAFAIIAIYTFLFGIMGTIEGMDTVIAAEAAAETEDEDAPAPVAAPSVDENGRAVYTYVTELNVRNGKKPSLADYTHTQPMLIVPMEEETTTAATTTAPPAYTIDDEAFDYTTPAKTSAPATTAAPETSTTSAPAAVTESSAITTLPPDYSEEEEDNQPFTDLPDIQDEEDEELEEPDEDDAPANISDDAPDYTLNNADEGAVPETTTTETEPQPAAADEIFTVNAEGKTMSGSALDIVACAVMAEIGDGFSDEAIKAQAIATYTYIKYYNDNNQNAYIVNRKPSDRMKKLVSEVLGKALYYNGSLIQAVYCASTAGYTASSKAVWGVDYPYLRSKATSFDEIYDINYGRKPTFTSSEMKEYVRKATGIELTGDPSTWFTIDSYVDNVYVGRMSIGGQSSYKSGNRTVNITGRIFRETIMDYNIRSTCFTIDYDADSDKFTITTYGYGHGVGLSQHGANILATYYGYDYEQILAFYYEGAVIM